MFAVVRTSGKQFKVSPGDVLTVDRLDGDASASVVLSDVLMVIDGEDVTVGSPLVAGARVDCTIVKHFRGPKIRVFKYKAKKRYRRTSGHRQELTVLRVESVSLNGAAKPARAKATAAPVAGAVKATVESRAEPAKRAGPKVVSEAKPVAKVRPKAEAKAKPVIEAKAKAEAKSKPVAKSKPIAKPKPAALKSSKSSKQTLKTSAKPKSGSKASAKPKPLKK